MAGGELYDELLARLRGLPPDKLADLQKTLPKYRFVPNPGPQTDAYFSKADLLLYGGQAGGGKSGLILGLALNEHKRTLIMRRRYADLSGLTDDLIKIYGRRDGFASAPRPKLRTDDGRVIEFGAAQHIGDEQSHQGQPHDLLAFDEAVHFAESQVRFLMGWVRSTEPGQRCRVVLASNPPVGSQGDWVIKMFAPWLDPTHPNPARAGELRWYVSGDDDQDIEVPDSTPYVVGERILIPQSRTFIPAKLTDNPFLANTDYQSKLDALPEPLRSALRDGNFMAARKDQDMQVIPTSWARAAVERWQSRPPQAIPMCGIGVDCGGGGKDPTIISYRHDGWYAPLVEMSPRDTPDGQNIGGKVLSIRRDNADVVIDAGGGYGNLPMRELRENNIHVTAYKGAEAATGRTADGQFGFVNKRSQVIWKFREALDPTQPGGSPIMLPDDPILISDLTAPTFEYTPRGIKVESKEDVVKKIGRSTDRGDSVCLAWSSGPRMASDGRTWLANRARLGNNSVTVYTTRDKKKDMCNNNVTVYTSRDKKKDRG